MIPRYFTNQNWDITGPLGMPVFKKSLVTLSKVVIYRMSQFPYELVDQSALPRVPTFADPHPPAAPVKFLWSKTAGHCGLAPLIWRIHEVWMPRTLKNNVWLLNFFVGREVFSSLCWGPPLMKFWYFWLTLFRTCICTLIPKYVRGGGLNRVNKNFFVYVHYARNATNASNVQMFQFDKCFELRK